MEEPTRITIPIIDIGSLQVKVNASDTVRKGVNLEVQVLAKGGQNETAVGADLQVRTAAKGGRIGAHHEAQIRARGEETRVEVGVDLEVRSKEGSEKRTTLWSIGNDRSDPTNRIDPIGESGRTIKNSDCDIGVPLQAKLGIKL